MFRKKSLKNYIDPEHIFQDARNSPGFNDDQFEGRMEIPVNKNNFNFIFYFFALAIFILASKTFALSVMDGEKYINQSKNNSFKKENISSARGIIFDRNNNLLAWNDSEITNGSLTRRYVDAGGFGTLLGYISYPKKDSSGFFWQTKTFGVDGIEKIFDSELKGVPGVFVSEKDVHGNIIGSHIEQKPVDGQNVTLSIDSKVQSFVYEELTSRVKTDRFKGAAALIMDLKTGEIITSTSYPEYKSEIMSKGTDSQQIKEYLTNKSNPFLHKPVDGQYVPGSVVKPIVAYAALDKKIISPEKSIFSAGFLRVPNPYKAGSYTQFNDWKAHGYTNIKEALAVSSDVYFYQIGGGFADQKGLGIDAINDYFKKFGFTSGTGVYFGKEPQAIIPNPKWKLKAFNGEPWRIGDTYNTSIGQYGFSLTPLQILRGISVIATDGDLITPTFIKGLTPEIEKIDNPNIEAFEIVKDGMRMVVTEGTAQGLNLPFVKVSAKTGTAQTGKNNEEVNSWITGYWPSDNPKYSFIVLLEKGPTSNTVGAYTIMRDTLNYMNENFPQYLH